MLLLRKMCSLVCRSAVHLCISLLSWSERATCCVLLIEFSIKLALTKMCFCCVCLFINLYYRSRISLGLTTFLKMANFLPLKHSYTEFILQLFLWNFSSLDTAARYLQYWHVFVSFFNSHDRAVFYSDWWSWLII